ncbi:MAG: hypothetical protein M1832_006413 [Thelocarpon impressellum]|nr:MAG: hypothetical protein M1832_006413 [Thelocarpon impressellum]
MFASCAGPIWGQDDFSHCFQRDYLQVLLPLLVTGLSIAFLLIQAVRIVHGSRRTATYTKIPNGQNVFGLPAQDGSSQDDDDDGIDELGTARRDDDDEEEDDDDDDEDEGGLQEHHLSLQRTVSATNASVVEVDRPRGQLAFIAVEELAVVAEVVIHLVALSTRAGGPNGVPAAVVGLVSWGYILALASMRLLLSSTSRFSFPKLWNHTAFLYGFQWLFTTLIFRSAIIHPRSRLAQILTIADFALVTLLFLIAVTTRKGNKAVVLEIEDGLEPSREPLASLFSLGTFLWVDAIVWKGYVKTFELADVWNLPGKDKAAKILQEFRQVKRTSALALHLLKYFRRLLLVQAVWAALSGLLTFAPTLLLKAILEYVEDPDRTPMNAAWFYVILLLVTGSLQALADGQALWVGRKICLRLRAVIIGEIYAKALRRKAAAGADTVLGAAEERERKPGLLSRIKSLGQKKKKVDAKDDEEDDDDDAKPSADEGSDSQVNNGTIINLMAVDSFNASEVTAYLHFLWAATPVQFVVAIVLLYRILGYSSIAGIGMMLLLLPVNIVIARAFSKLQKKIMAATDARIHTTNEVLQNIRIIKFFAWEQRFGGIVDEKRATELRHLRNRYILWSVATTIWFGAPLLITFLSFLVYTVVEGKDLIPSVAFTALSLFSILRVPLDQLADMLAHVQEAKVSVDRVDEFLREAETEKYEQLRLGAAPDHGGGEELPEIGLDSVTCTWGSRDADAADATSAFRLIELDVRFQVGELNIVVGPTGSGKTSVLMALLGEMTLLKGVIRLPGGRSREELRPDPRTGLTESVAYCAQQAWLVNDTIKQNILFASPPDKRRYKAVLVACALVRDLEILDAGDQTLVGEKGIALSGGQKQRISLARALYSNSRHLLLDDCLSAVDSHTAKWIFDHCIMGPLMYNRTCILVTHNIALCLPHAQHVLALDNGKIAAQGSPEHVLSSGVLGDEVQQSGPGSGSASRIPSRVASTLDNAEAVDDTVDAEEASGRPNGNALRRFSSRASEDGDAKLKTETKAEGGVKWRIVALYFWSMGSWWYWIASLAVFVAAQVGSVATNVWIRQWANSYHTKRVDALAGVGTLSASTTPFSVTCLYNRACVWNVIANAASKASSPSYSASSTSSSDVDVAYYLGVYALLGIVYLLLSLVRELMLFAGSLTASRKLHTRLFEAVTRAKFAFFDSTPLGQLMNRFSKDIEAVDQEVAAVAQGMLYCLASVITIIILISAITPTFLIAAVFIVAMYFFIGMFYIRSSRDLKRLESVQRSPLYQHFGETLSGITTIRAYGDERRFIRENLARVNTHNRPYIYLWATNRWLAFRVDVVGALVAFFAGAFVIMNVKNVDPGAAGLSLTYAVTFTENVLWLVRLYAVNEQNMNSVERVKEYLDVEQEAPAVVPESRPPANWPSKGSVQFINYTTRYRSDLEPVLRSVSFHIRPLEKVGIVGRTGAGKSSLALALFRGLEAEEGKILVDDVDIGLIGLQDLRESVTIVPQDPTLFTGTIRSNLDPFGIFTDEEIFAALRRVHLIGPGESLSAPVTPSTPTSGAGNKNVFLSLASAVTESGNNLSQGQKQLLCLARALLRSPKIIMMDEATASIDYSTDGKIQTTIRELDSTIVTIAHRLQTIIDYDKVLVLDKGAVVEYAHPWTLLEKEGGVFRGMCEMSGEMEALRDGARKAWRGKEPVDAQAEREDG